MREGRRCARGGGREGRWWQRGGREEGRRGQWSGGQREGGGIGVRRGKVGTTRRLTREGEGRGKEAAAGVEGAGREKECDQGGGLKYVTYI